MPHRIVFSSRARGDLRGHRDWYRSKDRSLAQRFNREALMALDSLADSPLRWAVWHPAGYRRILLSVFPHSIVYRVDGTTVTVLGILHQQQDAAARFPEDP
jgi:plasmid stabilization system protein ParE